MKQPYNAARVRYNNAQKRGDIAPAKDTNNVLRSFAFPANCYTPAQFIQLRAAARLLGRSFAAFVQEMVNATIEAAEGTAGSFGLPYSRRELNTLKIIGEA